jgi:hypothetical protein
VPVLPVPNVRVPGFCRIAEFHLENFESAKAAFEAGDRLTPKDSHWDSQFRTWIHKCVAELGGGLVGANYQPGGCME